MALKLDINRLVKLTMQSSNNQFNLNNQPQSRPPPHYQSQSPSQTQQPPNSQTQIQIQTAHGHRRRPRQQQQQQLQQQQHTFLKQHSPLPIQKQTTTTNQRLSNQQQAKSTTALNYKNENDNCSFISKTNTGTTYINANAKVDTLTTQQRQQKQKQTITTIIVDSSKLDSNAKMPHITSTTKATQLKQPSTTTTTTTEVFENSYISNFDDVITTTINPNSNHGCNFNPKSNPKTVSRTYRMVPDNLVPSCSLPSGDTTRRHFCSTSSHHHRRTPDLILGLHRKLISLLCSRSFILFIILLSTSVPPIRCNADSIPTHFHQRKTESTTGTLKDRLNFGVGADVNGEVGKMENHNSGAPFREKFFSSSNGEAKTKKLPQNILPKFLHTIYSRATEEGKLTTPYEGVNEIKVFHDKSGSGNKYTFSFSITDLDVKETVIAVELRFFIQKTAHSTEQQPLHVYQVIPPSSKINLNEKKPSTMEDTKQTNEYRVLYLTKFTINYLDNEQQVVKISPSKLLFPSQHSDKREKLRIIFSNVLIDSELIENPSSYTDKAVHESLIRNNDETDWPLKSILVLYVKDKLNVVEPNDIVVYPTVAPLADKVKDEDSKESGSGFNMRRRRRLSEPRIGYTRNKCRLVPFVANFTEIGWTKEFVIGPDVFEMNLCMGNCPWPNDQRSNATNHAIMQGTFSAYNSYVGRIKVPQPCCVPDKLLPLPLLYMEPSQNVILKTFRDMIASHCGCY